MTNGTVFEGLKIAEFAWVVVGPATSRYFAEHGATVVKIESHRRLDTMRSTSPFAGGHPTVDGSMAYGRNNANKYSVSIDLQSPGGRELAWKLIEWADVVSESFSPGTMEKWGLGYEDVKKRCPDVIYLSASMQGRGGPHSGYAGYGMNAVNLCGFTEVTGWPDRRPAAPHGAYTDYICARFNAVAILAALEYRRRTGKGQYIEQSQFETSLHFFAPPIMDYQANGTVTMRDGNRSPLAVPHGVFPSRGHDEWLAVSVMNDAEWRWLCEAIGRPGLAADYPTLTDRKAHEDELEKLVSEWTAQHSPAEAEAILRQAGVPCHTVARPRDVFDDAQLAARDYWQEMEHPVMGPQKYEPQSAFILSKTPRRTVTPSPCLGEHNEKVFREFLGLTDDDIAGHIVDGSITTEIPGEFKASM